VCLAAMPAAEVIVVCDQLMRSVTDLSGGLRTACVTSRTCPASSTPVRKVRGPLADTPEPGCYQPITLFELSAWGWRRRE